MVKFLKNCERVFTYLAMVCTAAITCLTTVDVVGRYLLNRPIRGAYELTQSYFMVTIVFLGLCYCYRKGGYIRVTFLVNRLPLQVNKALNYCVQVFCIALGILFFIAAVWEAYCSIISDVTLGFIRVPAWPPYVIVCIGFFSMILVLMFDLWKIKTGQSCLFKSQSSEP